VCYAGVALLVLLLAWWCYLMQRRISSRFSFLVVPPQGWRPKTPQNRRTCEKIRIQL